MLKELPYKKQNFPHAHIKNELRRSIGILRTDGKTSLRALQDCICKVLYVDISLGFIYKEFARVSQIAENINLKVSLLVNLSHCVMNEVWIKVAKTKEAWNFGFLAASPKSLFVSFFDYMAKSDEVSMGIKVLEHKEGGFNPSILISDLLPIYKAVSGYFSSCLHQLCTNHARRIIAKIIRGLPLEAKKDRFFYTLLVRIKKRFNALYEQRKKWAKSMLSFIERNSKGLFLYKRFPGKGDRTYQQYC